jgi:ABC-type antimicrobial peptide transport system permease subunit
MLWPDQNPLGKRLSKPVGEDPAVYWRVVGIVGDVRSGGLDRAPAPTVYRPYSQKGGLAFSLVIRAAASPRELTKTVRERIGRVDPDVPLPEIRTMPEIIENSVRPRRFQASLLSAFAMLAVVLAAIGIYGVVAHTVTQRRKEIGVRLALGAGQREIRNLILKNGMAPVFAGLAAGLLLAAILTRVIASLLFEVRPLDPLAFLSASLILAIAAALPCWLNARDAARIDPMVALRFE